MHSADDMEPLLDAASGLRHSWAPDTTDYTACMPGMAQASCALVMLKD